MDKEIEFKLLGIAKALKQERFAVPSNQREYSWLAEMQVKNFLKDITNALRNPEKPYFLGTIVITVSNGVYEIADGQQRIATTTMILAAIRDWFRAKGDSDNYKDIEASYLFTFDRKQQDTVPKLVLNVDDNEYFKNSILLPSKSKKDISSTKSHKLIAQAASAIKQFVEDIEKTYGLQNAKTVLNDLILYLEEKAMIVLLVVANSESAFMLFETMNDRGLKTSQVDLVKNHLFRLSGDRLVEAQKLWSSMKSAIESVSDEDDITIDFLRSVCCIMYGHTTKKDIMVRIRDNTPNKTEAITMLTTFDELSKDFAAIANPDHPKWNEYSIDTRKSIQAINLFGISQIRPLMLSVARFFNKKDTPIAFKKLVSWSVRFMVMGIRGGRLDEGYSRLAHAIFKGDIKTDAKLKEKAEDIVIGDAEFGKAFETAKVGVAKLARYYLRSLENTARDVADPEFMPNDGSAINLEHIMPLSLGKGWEHVAPQDTETHFARIGNMALLQAHKNSKIGDSPFEEKVKEYKKSNFLLTSQLADEKKWGISEIDNRQKFLSELAIKTWAL